jgi:RNA polymerase subunit RPABC4/transcription elongation factor Spt4
MRQKTCSACGDLHDMDDAICPHCGRRLMEL